MEENNSDKVVNGEWEVAPYAVRPPNDLGFKVFGHFMVEDNIGGFLKVYACTVGHGIHKEHIDSTMLEVINLFGTGYHCP